MLHTHHPYNLLAYLDNDVLHCGQTSPNFFLRGASKNLCLQPFRKRASSSKYVRRLYGRRVQMQWKVERFFSLFLIFVFLMNVFQFLQREAVEQTLNTAKDWLFMPMYKIDYEYRLLAIALDI